MKKNFDAPPDSSNYDPNLPTSGSLAKARALLAGTVAVPIDSDWTISATVIADDRSGNLYKQIVVDDGTTGMTLLLEANNLYGNYPVGRKIYLKTKGLYIGMYGGLPQIGMIDETGSMIGIPSTLIGGHVIKGDFPHPVIPDTVSLNDLNDGLLNRLIYIKDVEFAGSNLGMSYAQPSAIASGTSRTVEDCAGNTITLRTSGYANFQPYIVPSGKGGIAGIYTTYNGTPQLILRDTTDVTMYGERCGANTPFITIDSMQKMYTGADAVMPTAKISCIVISDRANGNTTASNVIVQDASGRGVVMYFSGSGNTPTYDMGDSLVVDITAMTLTTYQGGLELKANTSKVVNYKGNHAVTPLSISLDDLNASFITYQSTLVEIKNATVSGGGTYSGNKTLNDGTSTISLYTTSAAGFASQPVPTTPMTYRGIATPYTNGNEIKLRNLNDVY
ncbi:hypothetical protein DN068_15210 [Taibaiella soli]|uniref:DUF5689 domain-containing protein n=1 Tax=Taibaiella soli TaxID=1649169 RepID=A0A2W2AEI6_9BACT|nr:hypothetical protein DN068_15210 [Taibaiella soli]